VNSTLRLIRSPLSLNARGVPGDDDDALPPRSRLGERLSVTARGPPLPPRVNVNMPPPPSS